MRRLAPLIVLLLAAGLALHGLGRWSLTMAELWTWEASTGSWAQLHQAVAAHRHPPLHPALVAILLGLHRAEWVARLPSAVGGLAAVAILLAAGKRILGEGHAWVAALALVLSPMWIAWVGIARPYAGVMACGAGLLLAALELPQSPRRGALWLFLAGLVGLYLHYAMIACIGAAALGGGLALLRRQGGWRQLGWPALALVGIAVAFLPWALGPARAQAGETGWAGLSVEVLRYLAFAVDDFNPTEQLLLLPFLALGLWACRSRPAVLGMVAGALLLPLLLSVNLEARVRSYVFIGFLPLWALLVAAGLQVALRAPLAGGLVLLLVLGPGAVELAGLPGSPFGRLGDGLDDGVHDAHRDVALLAERLPPDGRLVLPAGYEADAYTHYAPGAVLESEGAVGEVGDWRLIRVTPAPGQRLPAPPQGCLLQAAFAWPFHLPDAAACEAVHTALAQEDAPPWLVERAASSTNPSEQEALLRRALGSSWPEPHLELAKLLMDSGRATEADQVARDGLSAALRWGWRRHALALLDLIDGDPATIACLRAAPKGVWMPQRCNSATTRWTVPEQEGRQGRPSPNQPAPRGLNR